MHKQLLLSRFGFDTFRPGQEEVILNVLGNLPTLAILPTASGKSLTYQLPAYMLEGSVVIASPLISLMEDQILQLREQGEKRIVAINSQLNNSDKQWVLSHLSEYKFIFVSPETLQQDYVLMALMKLKISIFVVDEAHCISQWGIDFRPEYAVLGTVTKSLKPDTVLALTASANQLTRADIIEKLFNDQEVKMVQQPIDRRNIAYSVVGTVDKLGYVKTVLAEHSGPGIIYFSSRQQAENVAFELAQECQQKISFYHGGLSTVDRNLIQQQFLNGSIDVLCATTAFGMGINKKDVRFVLHYHLPNNLEAYLQESGRAGRDGNQSFSTIIYQQFDEKIYNFQQKELQEAILFLKNEKHTQESLIGKPEVYQKWLNAIEAGKYSKNNLISELIQKNEEKKRALCEIMDYIGTTSCRRVKLLAYFEEDLLVKPDFCCDNCGFYDKMLAKSYLDVSDKRKEITDWHEKLKSLFKFN